MKVDDLMRGKAAGEDSGARKTLRKGLVQLDAIAVCISNPRKSPVRRALALQQLHAFGFKVRDECVEVAGTKVDHERLIAVHGQGI